MDPAGVRRVLLMRQRFLGDVCLTLPALDAVHAACPGVRVAYLVESEAASLLWGDPRIDELIVPRPSGSDVTTDVIRRIRRFAPDVVLDLFCTPRTALWTTLSGAAIRVGYDDKGWRSRLYTHRVRHRTLSAVGYHLASVEALGWPAPHVIPRLHIRPEARAEAEQELERHGVPRGARSVGFHPGARWPTRRWKPEKFASLARRLLDADRAAFVLVTGGPGDEALANEVLDGLPRGRAAAVIGLPIATFVALQSRCAAFVCGDTGPLHTAVAAGTPTLGLLSRNRPAMFFPYPEAAGHRAYYARVECSPCHRDRCDDLRCLERLTVDGAWNLLTAMLKDPFVAATQNR